MVNAENSEHTHPDTYVIGVDYGTLSGRAVVVRVADGAELAAAEHPYTHAVLDRTLPDGTPLPPDWALQVPSDYIDVLRVAVPEALARSGVRPDQVVGIGTDFTACTVLPVLADGTPCANSRTSPTARTPTSSSGATTPHRPRPTASPHWPPRARSPGSSGTAGRSPRSGSSPRPSSCSKRTPSSTS